MDESKLANEENKKLKLFQRPCTLEEFNIMFHYQSRSSTSIHQTVKRHYSKCSLLSLLFSLFPAFKWVPNYKLKADLMSDITSGFTVAIMHIPQGMAYAALGEVNPIVGVYMAIFPVFIYVLMGTSHHISMGTFSVVCLMAAKPIVMYSTLNITDKDYPSVTSARYSPIEVATAVCFAVGILQVIMGLCKIGYFSIFMSESLVKGFTTGAAVLVFMSQLNHVFGVELQKYFGIFNVLYTFADLIQAIPKINCLALFLSLCVICILLLYTEIIAPRFKCKYSLPIELIIIIIGTAISYCLKLSDHYSINVVGTIPTGLLAPKIPPLELVPKILVQSLVIAIVSFSINISLATLFALKENYSICASQEFIASGCSNIFGAFFSCLPLSASLSRSMIQYSSGGKTQLASLFSCLFLLSVTLYLAKFLEPLPYSILAGIVIKSLKSMLMQITELPKIWRNSIFDGAIWLITFLSVVLLNIEIGLAIALTLAMFSIILMNQKISVSLLGKVPNTDIYLELDRYSAAMPVPDFILIKIIAGLHFANIHLVKSKIQCLVKKMLLAQDRTKYYTLVLDMSTVIFIDPEALRIIKMCIKDLKSHKVNVHFAHCTGRVYEEMKKCDFFKDVSIGNFFPTIEDAVTYTLRQNNQVK